MDKKKLPIIINGIFAGLILVATVLFLTLDCSHYITKTIASALFVLCGAINLVFAILNKTTGKQLVYAIVMVAGLALACLGDILLIDHFVLGAIFFAMGHLAFLASFIIVSGYNVRDAIISVALFGLVFLFISLYKGFNFGDMKILVVVYALVICTMLGKAISNCFIKNNREIFWLIALGAFMFFVSDFFLMLYMFAGRVKILDIFCVSTYYPAEWVLAFSIFALTQKFVTKRKK